MNDQTLKQIIKHVTKGARKRIPANLLSRKFLGYDRDGQEIYSETQILDDAKQSALLKLLGSHSTDRQANSAGQTAARALVRQAEKFVPGTFDLRSEDGEIEEVPRWDKFDLSDLYRRPIAEGEELARVKAQLQKELWTAFAKECPRDYTFLVRYMKSRRKKPHTKQQQNRAGSIVERLRREYHRLCPSRIAQWRRTEEKILMPEFASQVPFISEGGRQWSPNGGRR